MPSITYVQPNGSSVEVDAADGTTLMRAAVNHGVDGIVGECGGQAMCATCHVYVRPDFADGLPEVSEDEDEMLDCTVAERTERSRLGCQIPVGQDHDGIVVDVPDGQV
ncbi:2Fe-2S iron-sulfur cluster-binding protein [Zhihengliuella somnathii]